MDTQSTAPTVDRPAERRSSRRGLISGAAGGMAALAARSLLRTPAASAADGDPILLGQGNESTAGTWVHCSGDGTAAFQGLADGPIPGLYGTSLSGPGVEGASGEGVGVLAVSRDGTDGVIGIGLMGNGVHGQSGGAESSGVWGENSSTGVGVRGTSSAGPGGIGVLGQAGATGTALRVEGKSEFTRSGLAVVPAGSKSVTVHGIEGMTSATLVLATIQRHCPKYWLESADPRPARGSFTIYVNEAPEHDVPVAWFVLN